MASAGRAAARPEGHTDVKRLASIILAAAAVAAAAAPAQAGVLVQSATSCDAQPLSQPFLRWLDIARYTPAPGGAFEVGDKGWTLSGGAATVAGNEPFHVHGAADARALRLPAGASAQSPAMCVGIDHPTLRLFTRASGASLLSSLRVDVLFESNLGLVSSLPVGIVLPSSAWAPSLPQVVLASLLPLLPGEQTAVAFRLTPQGPGTWDVDDVYVDPWSSR
jgi:hypothetical protein